MSAMQSVHVELGPRSYDIVLSSTDPDGLAAFARRAAPKATAALVVTDANVGPHAGGVVSGLRELGLAVILEAIPVGEAAKSLAVASQLYDRLADVNADRNCLVVAVGGGVVGDLAGFVAATYNRGLRLLMVPTTLLAMVDSSVGGKVAINHPKGKNLIGAFHQPVGVWIDPGYLTTLPEAEYRSGLAEVVKYGVILDAEFFETLEKNTTGLLARDPGLLERVIARCCRLKADVVEKDEREETGLRAVLNYGHTFAHAFEAVGGYGRWRHGEAVAAGMVCASRLAERLGLVPPEVTGRQVRLLAALGLPVAPLADWSVAAVIEAMYRDKKAVAGRLRFVLPTAIGQVKVVENVPDELVREVLRP